MAEIQGKDWHGEIGTPHASKLKYDDRSEFYSKRMQLKLGQSFDDVIKNLVENGYKTLEDHKGKNRTIDIRKGDTLFVLLKKYYMERFSLPGTKAEKETYLTLAYVMKTAGSPGNVDELEIGGKIEIKDGKLKITNAAGEEKLNTHMRPKGTAGSTTTEDGKDKEEDGKKEEDKAADAEEALPPKGEDGKKEATTGEGTSGRGSRRGRRAARREKRRSGSATPGGGTPGTSTPEGSTTDGKTDEGGEHTDHWERGSGDFDDVPDVRPVPPRSGTKSKAGKTPGTPPEAARTGDEGERSGHWERGEGGFDGVPPVDAVPARKEKDKTPGTTPDAARVPGSPTWGTDTPPAGGTDTPPAGTDTPPAGTDTPPAGTDTPPAGTDTPPAGTDTPPAGTDTPPAGTDTPPAGTDTPPAGTDTPPTGTDTPPTGTDTPPTGTDTPPTGTDTPPTGTDTPPTGTDTPPTGTDTPPAGTDTPPAGTDTPPEADVLPTDPTPEEVIPQGEIIEGNKLDRLARELNEQLTHPRGKLTRIVMDPDGTGATITTAGHLDNGARVTFDVRAEDATNAREAIDSIDPATHQRKLQVKLNEAADEMLDRRKAAAEKIEAILKEKYHQYRTLEVKPNAMSILVDDRNGTVEFSVHLAYAYEFRDTNDAQYVTKINGVTSENYLDVLFSDENLQKYADGLAKEAGLKEPERSAESLAADDRVQAVGAEYGASKREAEGMFRDVTGLPLYSSQHPDRASIEVTISEPVETSPNTYTVTVTMTTHNTQKPTTQTQDVIITKTPEELGATLTEDPQAQKEREYLAGTLIHKRIVADKAVFEAYYNYGDNKKQITPIGAAAPVDADAPSDVPDTPPAGTDTPPAPASTDDGGADAPDIPHEEVRGAMQPAEEFEYTDPAEDADGASGEKERLETLGTRLAEEEKKFQANKTAWAETLGLPLKRTVEDDVASVAIWKPELKNIDDKGDSFSGEGHIRVVSHNRATPIDKNFVMHVTVESSSLENINTEARTAEAEMLLRIQAYEMANQHMGTLIRDYKADSPDLFTADAAKPAPDTPAAPEEKPDAPEDPEVGGEKKENAERVGQLSRQLNEKVKAYEAKKAEWATIAGLSLRGAVADDIPSINIGSPKINTNEIIIEEDMIRATAYVAFSTHNTVVEADMKTRFQLNIPKSELQNDDSGPEMQLLLGIDAFDTATRLLGSRIQTLKEDNPKDFEAKAAVATPPTAPTAPADTPPDEADKPPVEEVAAAGPKELHEMNLDELKAQAAYDFGKMQETVLQRFENMADRITFGPLEYELTDRNVYGVGFMITVAMPDGTDREVPISKGYGITQLPDLLLGPDGHRKKKGQEKYMEVAKIEFCTSEEVLNEIYGELVQIGIEERQLAEEVARKKAEEEAAEQERVNEAERDANAATALEILGRMGSGDQSERIAAFPTEHPQDEHWKTLLEAAQVAENSGNIKQLQAADEKLSASIKTVRESSDTLKMSQRDQYLDVAPAMVVKIREKIQHIERYPAEGRTQKAESALEVLAAMDTSDQSARIEAMPTDEKQDQMWKELAKNKQVALKDEATLEELRATLAKVEANKMEARENHDTLQMGKRMDFINQSTQIANMLNGRIEAIEEAANDPEQSPEYPKLREAAAERLAASGYTLDSSDYIQTGDGRRFAKLKIEYVGEGADRKLQVKLKRNMMQPEYDQAWAEAETIVEEVNK